MKILDIHTHDSSRENAIINLSKEVTLQPGKLYSAGLHPWDTDAPDADKAIDRLEIEAASPLIAAIGEAGLDACAEPTLTDKCNFCVFSSK